MFFSPFYLSRIATILIPFSIQFQVRHPFLLRRNFQPISKKEWMCGLFFPFSCCYVVILVWSLILSGIILEALVLSLRCRGSCLIYPKTTDAFLIAFLFSLRRRKEKSSLFLLHSFPVFFIRANLASCHWSSLLFYTRHLGPKEATLYKILATGNLRLGPRRPETCLKVAGMGYEDINSSPYLYKNCHLR